MEFGEGTAHLFPSDDALAAMSRSDDTAPIVMVNLLKLKEGGGAALDHYLSVVTPLLEGVGGSFVYVASVTANVIGNPDWDVVALVRYPSRKAFVQMVTSEEYASVGPYRAAGLDRAELLMTVPPES